METISVTNCPTCGALAQALPEDKWRSVENVHAVYDFVRQLHVKTFNCPNDELSIPEICEQLMLNAEHVSSVLNGANKEGQ